MYVLQAGHILIALSKFVPMIVMAMDIVIMAHAFAVRIIMELIALRQFVFTIALTTDYV